MKDEERDIDRLLDELADRTLQGFDWDHLHLSIASRLTGAVRRGRPVSRFHIASVVTTAALLLLGTVLICHYLRPSLYTHTEPKGTTCDGTTSEADPLLACTDPHVILPRGALRMLVSNDPTLAPHSLWQQTVPLEGEAP
jgi:hypothetical protein